MASLSFLLSHASFAPMHLGKLMFKKYSSGQRLKVNVCSVLYEFWTDVFCYFFFADLEAEEDDFFCWPGAYGAADWLPVVFFICPGAVVFLTWPGGIGLFTIVFLLEQALATSNMTRTRSWIFFIWSLLMLQRYRPGLYSCLLCKFDHVITEKTPCFVPSFWYLCHCVTF